MTRRTIVKRAAGLAFSLIIVAWAWWQLSSQLSSRPDSVAADPVAAETQAVSALPSPQTETTPPAPTRRAAPAPERRGAGTSPTSLESALSRWSEASPFRQWSERYMGASADEKAALIPEGVALAEARRPQFRQLIVKDPREALRQAVPPLVRQELPSEVLEQLEERINARAALRVYQGVGDDNLSPVPTVRVAELTDGRSRQAYVYGRRAESVRWLSGASLNGVAIDQDFAVHEDPVRPLELGEMPDTTRPAIEVCPVSGKVSAVEEEVGQPITEDTPAVEAFGEIVYLCNGSHVTIYREQLIYAEGGTGGPIPFTGILPAAPTPSIGNVRVLVIPMTFADQNDTPSSEATLYQLMRDVGYHYALASYGKLSLLTTVTPPIKLPHNEAWYIQKDSSNGGSIDGLGLEHSHARAEARKLGFDDNEFDCVVVRLRGGPRTAGGYGGGASVWIYGDGVDVTAHEIGHSFGLAHANYWDTAGTSATGAGSNAEYGGHWDVMGGIGLPYGHYNIQGKNQIKWLPSEYVTEVIASGTYRIYAQDQPVLDPSQRYALKIRKDNLRTYWGELRGLYTGHATRTWADFGLILGWRYPGAGGSNWQLIDTTPGSSFGKDDSPISLGRTFSDTEAGLHLTTIAVNAATATEPKSVDVVVHLGDFSSNQPPTLALAASALVVPLNVPITFTATASDPDGDALAYSWQHFGDANYRTISPAAPIITRTFTAAGTYAVTCTASDMKGGSSIRSVLITAGNGAGRFTISGRVTLDGIGLPGVILNANAANAVMTDSDGRYTIPNLTAATYTMTPLLYGYTFTELFNNSVAVGPGFEGADFEAAATARVRIEATTPACLESGVSGPAQFTLTRTGDASQSLTVNIIPPSGSATLTTDYTLSPTPAGGSQGLSNVTFAAGSDTFVLSVTPVADTAAEGPEAVNLELAPGNSYLVDGLARATVIINDDDTNLPKISLATGAAKTVEGAPSPASIVFTRTGSVGGPVIIPYTVSGTAVSGTDFNPLTGTLLIPAGAASARLNITSRDDAVSETVETVTISIASAANYLADPLANAVTISIVDGDVQIVNVTASDPIATERDLSISGATADTATFLITRSGDTSQPLSVYYAMAGTNGGPQTALHGVDYEALPGVLIIPAGQPSGSVTIIARWDQLGEGPESVRIQLGAGPTNYRLGPANAAEAIVNDAGDPPYVEVLCADNAVEGGTVGRFRFSLKGSAAGSVTVNYTLTGTATSSDYTGLSGSVAIPGNGFNFVDVNVTAVNDTLAENLETIVLTLTPSANYQAFGPTATTTMWVLDNEQPTVFVDANAANYPPSVTENGSGGTFYLSRTGGSGTAGALTVTYAMSGTAGNGVDFQTASGTAVIPAGSLGVDVPIVPINDTVAEGTETITLTLAAGAYGRGPAATLNLTDDESPSIVVGFPSSSSAGAESVSPVNVPVTLSAASAAPVSVEYVVESGSRASSTANGVLPSALPYWVRCDRIGNLIRGAISSDGTNWTGVSTQTVALSSTLYLVGLHVCSFNVSTLSTSVFDNVIITNLQPGATIGTRLAVNVGTTTLAGSASVAGTVYTVAGAGDNVEGTTDQGYLTYWPINNSTNCTIIARVISQQNTDAGATAGVMIRETTANNVRRGYMATTPGDGFEFHYRTAAAGNDAKVSTGINKPVWVRLQRSGNTVRAFQSWDGSLWSQVGTNLDLAFAPEVFAGLGVSAQAEGRLATAIIDNVTLTPGPLPPLSGRTVGLTATQGTDSESGGVYTITASGDGLSGTSDDFHFLATAVTGNFEITARIVNVSGNATAPQAGVVVRDTYTRRGRSAYFGGPAGVAPQLIWRSTTTTTANGAGIDFTLPTGVLNFSPGTTTQNIVLNVTDDTRPEPDESVTLVLRNANGARLGLAQYTYVIADNDTTAPLPSVGFAATTSSAHESAGLVQVPVSLSFAATGPVAVDYVIAGLTAVDGIDFNGTNGTLVFQSGETVRSISLTLLDNANIELSRTIQLTLNAVTGGRPGSLTNHTFTILDDDRPAVTLVATDANASEAGDTAQITLTRTGSTTEALAVSLSRTGSASPGTDYTGIDFTAIIPAGAASIPLTLVPVQDSEVEGAETAIISVAPGTGYTPGSGPVATLTIADDDRNIVTIAATGATALEGGTNGTFTVTRTGATDSALTVNLTVSGTATLTADFTTAPAPITTLVLAAGQSARTIAITPVNDATIEGDEEVLVQIGPGTYDVGGLGYASVTIVDNDVPPVVFINSPAAQGVVVATSNGVEFAATALDDGRPQPLAYVWSKVAGPGVITFDPSDAAVAPATFSVPGTYLVRVTVSDGQFTASDQITVNVGATNSLVAGDWISSDIGPATIRGFAGRSDGRWILSAGGVGYATTSDRAHAVTRQVEGNGSIVARVVSVAGTNTPEAGISIRDSLHRYSRRAALLYAPATRTLRLRPRLVSNTTDFSLNVANLNLPLWLRLDRDATGQTVAGYYAADNAGTPGAWTRIGTNVNVTMDAIADYSLTADSGSDTAAAVATLDNLTLTPAPIGTAALNEDFGGSSQMGSYTYDAANDLHTLMGRGGLDGSGFFHGQQVSGDFTVTVLMTNATSSATDARSGLMVRDSMDDGPMAFLGRIPTGSYASFVWRTNPKGGTSGLNGITQRRRWLRLIRRGNQLTALHAADVNNTPGTWAQLGPPRTVFLQPTVLVGLYCDNAGGGAVGLNTANFTRLSVVPLNRAPIVDAGPAPSGAAPIALNGRVSDDGLPEPLVTEWVTAVAAGSVTFTDSGAPTTTVALSASGLYTLRLWADDGLARTYDDVSFNYTSTNSPFAAWQAANFTGGASNPNAAPHANPDGDGLDNLSEYAHDTNPNLANASPIITELVTIGSDQFLRVRIPKNPAATDVTFTIDGADGVMGPWSTAGLVTEVDTPTEQSVRDGTPVSSSAQRSLRIRIALP